MIAGRIEAAREVEPDERTRAADGNDDEQSHNKPERWMSGPRQNQCPHNPHSGDNPEHDVAPAIRVSRREQPENRSGDHRRDRDQGDQARSQGGAVAESDREEGKAPEQRERRRRGLRDEVGPEAQLGARAGEALPEGVKRGRADRDWPGREVGIRRIAHDGENQNE